MEYLSVFIVRNRFTDFAFRLECPLYKSVVKGILTLLTYGCYHFSGLQVKLFES